MVLLLEMKLLISLMMIITNLMPCGIKEAKELCIEVFVYGKVGNDWVMLFKDGNSIIRTNFIKRDNYTTILLHNNAPNFNNLKYKARA